MYDTSKVSRLYFDSEVIKRCLNSAVIKRYTFFVNILLICVSILEYLKIFRIIDFFDNIQYIIMSIEFF
jgi:hypothetical protein